MAVSGRRCWWMSILNQLQEDLKVIFLKCKIRFIYVGFNCKRKKGGKKCLEICAIKGGGSTPNGKNHLKFPFWLFDTLPYSVEILPVICRNLSQFCQMQSIYSEIISIEDDIFKHPIFLWFRGNHTHGEHDNSSYDNVYGFGRALHYGSINSIKDLKYMKM